MVDYFLTWLTFTGFGLLFGFFPGYFVLVYYIARAYEIHHKDVPGWLRYIAGSNQSTNTFDFSIKHSYASHILVWALFTPWIFMCLASSNVLAVENAGGDLVKTVLTEVTFPVTVLATWILPSFLLRRYLRGLELQEKYR